jgi:predicted solute-binding protein
LSFNKEKVEPSVHIHHHQIIYQHYGLQKAVAIGVFVPAQSTNSPVSGFT